MGVGRRGNFFVRTWHRLRALFASTDVGWVSKIDKDAANILVRDWARRSTRRDTKPVSKRAEHRSLPSARSTEGGSIRTPRSRR